MNWREAKPETGVDNGIPWVRYPLTGEAWQNDEFILEEARRQSKAILARFQNAP